MVGDTLVNFGDILAELQKQCMLGYGWELTPSMAVQ